MPTLLLEIGCEELPSGAVAPALEQFTAALLARLRDERLAVADDAVETFATPRRLTVRIADVPARQPDAETEVRGPGVKAAFGPDGNPTKAAIGFAQRNQVAPEDLTVQGEYVVARRLEVGRAAGEVIGQAVPELLRGITFPKFLRWGAGNYRWGRPLRRFVALFDNEVIPFTVEEVTSGRETVGHRYYHPAQRGALTIDSPATYEATLRAALVEPIPAIRRQQIVGQAQQVADAVGGRVVLPDALVDENVYLTEWVTAVLGNFDPAYLALPRPVLVTSMQKNQRYFPVEDSNGQLMPHFVAIRNGVAEHIERCREGYEKVLASRFNDARFFFEHDRQGRLEDRLPKTERIVFQERLGTLADKTKRLEHLLTHTTLLHWTHDGENALRAARLSKADLASEIVAELPSLQGVMGREFARLEGEPEAVAVALYEQYLPRTSGDSLPQSRIGTALALADRVDTLVGYMRFVGAEPKGSSDPFGLKRAASAIADILAQDTHLPALSVLVATAEAGYRMQGIVPAEKPGDLMALVATRLEGLLSERGIRHDLVDALLAAPYDNVASVVGRADVLRQMLPAADGVAVAQVATRVRNILRSVKEPIGDTVSADALTTAEERTLHTFLLTVTPQVNEAFAQHDYTDALDTLAALADPINRFFDGVLVMAEDPAVRAARLSLLKQADDLFLRLADFSKLVGE